jgi:hypothetical protein
MSSGTEKLGMKRATALVVRNGLARSRKVTTGAGTMEVRAPRVNDRRVTEAGERERFSSQILPPYMRRSPKVAGILQAIRRWESFRYSLAALPVV